MPSCLLNRVAGDIRKTRVMHWRVLMIGATLLVVAGLYKPEMKIEIEVTAKRRA